MRTPIGVIVMIYESRAERDGGRGRALPEVGERLDPPRAAAKRPSSAALVKAIRAGLSAAGVDGDAVQYVERPEYEAIDLLVAQAGLIDLVIPRGGEALIQRVVRNSAVPVIKHYKGVCHLYVDESADLAWRRRWPSTARSATWHLQRPGEAPGASVVATRFLPLVAEQDAAGRASRRRGDAGHPADGRAATEEDWSAEYLDLILTVKVVDGLEEAVRISNLQLQPHGRHHQPGRGCHRTLRQPRGLRGGHGERVHPSE